MGTARALDEALGATAGLHVRRRLVAALLALDEGDDATARAHADIARGRAGRVGLVREATGVISYRLGDYDVAVRDLRAARRISAEPSTSVVLADCERALGRPERALEVLAELNPRDLERDDLVEYLIVKAGAAADTGHHDVAVSLLSSPLVKAESAEEWQERLWYALGQALVAAGRPEEGRRWLLRAAGHPAGVTDAHEVLTGAAPPSADAPSAAAPDLPPLDVTGPATPDRQPDDAAGRATEDPTPGRGPVADDVSVGEFVDLASDERPSR